MADSKITALTSISTSTDPANDPLVIVDVSDTSMAATGTTKKVTLNQLLATSPSATLASATITGDLTVRTNKLAVTSTGVGVGTVSPGQPLDIVSDSGANGIIIRGRSADDIATLNFATNAASVAAQIQMRPGGNELRYLVTGAKSQTFYTNGSEQMRIDSSGNVGIGVTPSAWASGNKFIDINSSAAFGAFGSSDAMMIGNAYWNGSSWIRKTANNAWRFVIESVSSTPTMTWQLAANGSAGSSITTWTQAMTLDASGNLLVGTTSASNQERLNVSSALSLYVARVFNTASSGGNYGIQIRYSNAAPNNATNEFLACSDNAASRAFIYANGGLANYQANDSNLSDARTKTDIKPLASYWNKIKSLEVVTFKYKDQTHSDDNIGLIAQQVESVAPEFVSNEGFGEVPEDGVPLKTIYTTDLYHAAIKALQEAMTRIEALEAKLA